jgi:hypothetical protein
MTTKEPQPFSLSELAELPMTHDPDPENSSTGCWVGKIKPSVLEQIYELREAERRRFETPECVKALGHLADHLEGWRQTLLAEGEA